MPTLETADGKPLDVAPVDTEAVNRDFSRAMSDAPPAGQAPPKRQPKLPGDEAPKPRQAKAAKDSRARATAKSGTVLSDAQRAEGVKGLAQVGAGIALIIGKATKNDAFQADAVTIASHADEISDAVVQIAKSDPAFAARVDKICAAGPYSALIVVGISIASQCARNHRPSLSIPGTVDPAVLLEAQETADVAAAA